MAGKKPIVAIMYDFDKTLCTKNMQEYGFIQNMNMKPTDFWGKAQKLAKDEKMDNILAYMYLMVKESNKNEKSIRREDFKALGKDIEYFKGTETWFERINQIGDTKGLKIEHYIISSGLKEIIEGTSIARNFKEIYACEYLYDQYGVATWPKIVVNYTDKTQFLFRINKGILDLSEEKKLNEFTPSEDRPIPFRNMIYIGDGLTDVPCMKLVRVNGGQSIAVTQRGKPEIGKELMNDGRVNFVTRADYSEGSEIEEIVTHVFEKIAAIEKLAAIHKKHKKASKKVVDTK